VGMMTHSKIQFEPGETLEECVELLLKHKTRGLIVYGVFNGIPLYSDSVSVDSAYVLVMGKIKAQFDEDVKKEADVRKIKRESTLSKENIDHWIKAGQGVLDEKHWAYWKQIVPIRLSDIYQGAELGDSLAVIRVLNTGGSFDHAKKTLDDQGHSGMSFSLIRSMVVTFSDLGADFFKSKYKS
jgi:hypothetical protein